MMKLTKYGLKFQNAREASLASEAVKGETRLSVKRSKSGLFFNSDASRNKAHELLMHTFAYTRI